VCDIASLAGGVDRVVDTALVALVESGRVRVFAPGAVEGAVMDARGAFDSGDRRS
jgi:uncharacterized protein (TIGR04222 family)